MRRIARSRPEFQALESRDLPAASPFAVLEGTLNANRRAELSFQISESDFDLSGRRTLLAFETSAAGVRVGSVTGAVAQVAAGGPSGPSRVLLAAVGPGHHSLRLFGPAGTQVPVSVSLVGDLDADGVVRLDDLANLQSRIGSRTGDSGFLPDADIDRDGRITRHDLSFARRNLADSTTITPLAVDLVSNQTSPTQRIVPFAVIAPAGSTVSILAPDGTSTILEPDAQGLRTFVTDLAVGDHPYRALAVDRFGQRVLDTETASRTTAASGTYLSFAFEPYVKQWEGQAPPNDVVPAFNSYGTGNASVTNQINLVAPYTTQLATYGTGYAGYYPTGTPYNQTDSNWMVAPTAATYNSSQNSLSLTVSQGIYQQGTADQWTTEINNAFAIAAAANATYPGTVNRLIFTNEYVTDETTTNQVLAFINQYKAQAHAAGIEVGVRSNTFGNLLGANTPYQTALQNLVKACDFIMLNIYPSPTATNQGITASINELASEYTNIKNAAIAQNSSLEVFIGETGWPSQGLSFNNPDGTLNTVANTQAYYTALHTWANQNQVRTFFFEAIDEPWKSNQNLPVNAPNFWQGPNGAEGHYGIWTYSTSDNNGSFSAKFAPIAIS